LVATGEVVQEQRVILFVWEGNQNGRLLNTSAVEIAEW
jgi:hypothetical protein